MKCSEDNYFFTSQDADSEGVEGLYFTYTKNEIREALESYSQEHDLSIDIELHKRSLMQQKKVTLKMDLNTLRLTRQS